MDKRKRLFLVAGVILIVMGAMIFMNRPAPSPPPPAARAPAAVQKPRYAEVVIARRDINKGTIISQDDVRMKRIYSDDLKREDLDSLDIAIGKVATDDIIIGEKITKSKIAVKPSSQKLAMKVPEGKRALTIPIDKIASLEGMIRPGDNVDIVGTFPFTQSVEGKVVTQNIVVPMFENVLVLAVGSMITSYGASGGYGSVTFALNPDESTLLIFATQTGKIRLLLRSPLDMSKSRARVPVTMDMLWQKLLSISYKQPQKPKKPEPSPPPPKKKVEVYVGGAKQEQK